MDPYVEAFAEFCSQPWGAAGALCIMLAVTCFNSRRLQQRFMRIRLSREGMGFVLNVLNLVGGICLLVNAVRRDEVVWKVLEVYFIAIAVKGVWQNRAALRAFFRADPLPSG